MGSKDKKLVIVGAGFSGRNIAIEIDNKKIFGRVVAFLDDDRKKIGGFIDQIAVHGPIESVAHLLSSTVIDEAVIAIPTISHRRLYRIHKALTKAGIKSIKLLPALSQIIDGEAHLIQTRKFMAEDLLNRDPVVIPLKESLTYLTGKRVMVTGAGGSIGSELCRQLLFGGVQRIYLFDHDEFGLFKIEQELKILQQEGMGKAEAVIPILGSITDLSFIKHIIDLVRADIIFHCAAYKQVPMAEDNPTIFIHNNVIGTVNIIEAIVASGVKKLVLISSDKAVEPEGIYGCSKLLAEEYALSRLADRSIVVRFGNVLGSRGSILPFFHQQIQSGGPLTLTDEKMERFFMTIPEAVSLVLQAGGAGQDGMLYLLDMGNPMKIKELAEQMIRFYGYEPEIDIKIEIVGLRPGEKLNEKLYGSDEQVVKTDYSYLLRIIHRSQINGDIYQLIAELRAICEFNSDKADYYQNRQLLIERLAGSIKTFKKVTLNAK